jgi:phospholipase C
VTGRALRAAAGLLPLLAAGVLTGAPAAGATADPVPTTPIRHVVVMTQDGHSFDSYLGRRPGVDGLPEDVCVPMRADAATPCQPPFAVQTSSPRPRLDVSATAQLAAVDDGRMDGFIRAQSGSHTSGRDAMGYYRAADLPVLNQLADHGVVFDRWFSAVPGGGIVNQLFAVSGVAVPDTAAVPAGGWPDLPLVFDRLDTAGVSWKVYVENYEPALTVSTAGSTALRGGQVARVPLLAMTRYERDPALLAHVADLEAYYRDLADGTLPAVSWVVTNASSERAPARPLVGQRIVRDVANALGESSAWPESLFVVSYASSGGRYDHVPPPTDRGVRVPAVLVSPYAAAGTVDHTTLDSAAVLRFLQDNWRLPPLSARVSDSPGLAPALRLDQPPAAAVLVSTAPPRPPIDQPNTRVIVIGYLLAGLAAAGSVLWATRARPGLSPAEIRLDPS